RGTSVTYTQAGVGTTYSVTGLTAGTSYFWKVSAYYTNSASASNLGTQSSETVATPGAVAPTGLTVSSNTATSVALSWTAPSGNVTAMAGYNIYQVTSSGTESTGTSYQYTQSGTGTTYTVTGLTQGTTY